MPTYAQLIQSLLMVASQELLQRRTVQRWWDTIIHMLPQQGQNVFVLGIFQMVITQIGMPRKVKHAMLVLCDATVTKMHVEV